MEQAAATSFKPWQHEPGEWKPPTRAEWIAMADNHAIIIRAAWISLFNEKDVAVRSLTEEPDTLMGLLDDIGGCIAEVKNWLAILEAAEARLLCAASEVAMRESTP